jgi:polyphenol oxidase
VPRPPANLPLFTFATFPRPVDGIVHAISTRHGGVSPAPYDSLNLSLSVPDDPARVRENRRRFAAALGVDPDRLVSSRQVHGDDVLMVDDRFSTGGPLPAADVQVTDRAGWLLTLRFADCVPLLLVHSGRRVVAAVHAGWRGTLKGAVGTALAVLRDRYAAEPDGVRVGIGPSIGPCCYEVGEEVAEQFADRGLGVLRTAGRPRLDLWELNRRAVLAGGVPAGQVEVARVCTRCHVNEYFSHRAQGYPAGRFSAAIGLA